VFELETAMADQKQCLEDVISDNSITQQHTSSSQGLHHDHIAEEALGGHTADLGKSYFTSINFIGTVIVRSWISTLHTRSHQIGHMPGANFRVSMP